MKFPTLLAASALFLAASVSAVMPDDPAKIDTCVKPGVVALTFDDGPGAYNDQLLALLRKKNVKATFFVLGSMAAENPTQAAALKNIVTAGHQLASHTYSHSNLDLMSEDAMRKEMSDTSDIIFKNTNLRVAYMRAPEGNCGAVCTKVMNELGLVISHWNVDTNDWRFKALPAAEATEKSMEEINKVVIKESNPATDSFILLEHEIHKFSVDFVAERVIDSIIAKGYKFVTMEECVGKPAYFNGAVVPPPGPSSPVLPGANMTSSGAVTPTATGSASKPIGATTTGGAAATTTGSKNTNGAGSLRVGAWAVALVSAVGYALF
ncbi:hypothetical protein BGZ83_001834 [Gryganskiella cystojenkinii]|nr:hypothetical protein BGZ83_001834 [Gryganskiella cystojenkinii]